MEGEVSVFNQKQSQYTRPVSYTHLDVYKRQYQYSVQVWLINMRNVEVREKNEN